MASNKKSGAIKWIVVIAVIAAVAGFGAKYYSGMKAAEQKQAAAAAAAKRLPVVFTEKTIAADLAFSNSYIGRVVPIQTVQLKAQVAGEIMKVNFKEGSLVKQGDLLIQIDDRQYKATAALRRADLEKAKAAKERAEKYLNRLRAADKRSISASDMELAESNFLQTKAAVEEAAAALKLAEINLGFTKVTAPITGRIGAALLTKGNYVSPASGVLATIVQIDPIRVSFTMADRDYLDQLEEFKKKGSVYETVLTLSNGRELRVNGRRDFEDNRVDDKTGTLDVRIRFDNKSQELVPGSMVRIATKSVKKVPAVLVSQKALVGDSQGDFVYVVENGTAKTRRIVLGAEAGSLREVKEGLKAGEEVVVRGIQSIRNGSKVDAKPEGTKADASARTAE